MLNENAFNVTCCVFACKSPKVNRMLECLWNLLLNSPVSIDVMPFVSSKVALNCMRHRLFILFQVCEMSFIHGCLLMCSFTIPVNKALHLLGKQKDNCTLYLSFLCWHSFTLPTWMSLCGLSFEWGNLSMSFLSVTQRLSLLCTLRSCSTLSQNVWLQSVSLGQSMIMSVSITSLTKSAHLSLVTIGSLSLLYPLSLIVFDSSLIVL